MTPHPRAGKRGGRPGAVALESAVVYPVMIFLLLALVVGGTRVFRYQQVACLAREAARAACVKGSDWQKATGKTSPTRQQLFDDVVLPRAAGMGPEQLTLSVVWVNGATGATADWDSSTKAPTSIHPVSGESVTNRLRVTVTYQWTTELFGIRAGPLTSVSEVPMAF